MAPEAVKPRSMLRRTVRDVPRFQSVHSPHKHAPGIVQSECEGVCVPQQDDEVLSPQASPAMRGDGDHDVRCRCAATLEVDGQVGCERRLAGHSSRMGARLYSPPPIRHPLPQ